jgi:uncharacterized membrane protein
MGIPKNKSTNFKNLLHPQVSAEEYQLLHNLRERKPAQNPPKERLSVGNKIADAVAATMGSWRFIIIQSILLTFWVILNVVVFSKHWDPYPFILLNLMLSFQAAYAAPIIMMSQNRQATIDRLEAKHDYEVNTKAELEIELLHDTMDLLKEQELSELKEMLVKQQQQIGRLEKLLLDIHQKVNAHID